MRWRREWDSNPRYSFPHTRFPSVRLKPLGHLSGRPSLETARSFLQAVAAGDRRNSANILNNNRIVRHNPPSVELYFGPKAPVGQEGRWIQTIPGRGWFAYFRIYGPETAAFDGSWRPADFEGLK